MVATGRSQIVLISGPSGIGKSSLGRQLEADQQASGRRRARFACGKFDQYQRNRPYAPIAEAFEQLLRNALQEDDAALAPLREALQRAVGINGQLLVELVPELELLIGAQPAVPTISVEDAKNRFRGVLGARAERVCQRRAPARAG